MNSPSTLNMSDAQTPDAPKGKTNHSAVTLKGLIFVMVLVAGATAIGGSVKGSLGVWSAILGGGLAISNYLAFMWIWQRLTTAPQEDFKKYSTILTMKFIMAGIVIFMVFFTMKPDALFFLASYSALLPAMFFVSLLRG